MSNKKRKNSNYVTKNPRPVAKKKKKLSQDAIVGIVCLAVILLATIFSFTFCAVKRHSVGKGACEYVTTRNVEGHDIKYVKMMVKGYGGIVLMLDATTAPKTVENFMKLVNDGFYDGLTFHRIIENFMIQGGDPKGNGTGGQLDANGKEINIVGEFKNNGYENDISHKRGVISMARNGYSMDSASSQFFICNADASASLDGQYAAFGYVIAGMDVVDKITRKGVKRATNDVIENKNKQPVITSIVEITEEEAMKYVK